MSEHINPDQALARMTAAPLGHETPLQKATREVSEMYKVFKEEIDIDTVITRSEFSKYEVLFSKEALQDCVARKMSMDETNDLRELSQEYYRRVNPQRPVHVVDDYSKEELFALPPIYTRLRPLEGEHAGIIDIYNGVYDSKRDGGGVIMEMKKQEVDNVLYQTFANTQNIQELKQSMNQFETLAKDFHEKVLGNNPFVNASTVNTSKEVATQQQLNNNTTAETADRPDDDFDF
jgi:hypothetical protein